MTRILTIIALLFATPVAAQSNSADGKSFFCKPLGLEKKVSAVGLTFREGKPILIGEDGENEVEMAKEYSEALQAYRWKAENSYFEINRSNLIFSWEIDKINEKLSWQCEINELSEVRNKLKNIVAEIRQGNKF